MAEESAKNKAPRKRKGPETVRERAEKQSAKKSAPPKTSKLKGKIHRPLSTLSRVGKKEYHPVRVPEKSKTGKVLNKRVKFVPKFVREAWAELKLVVWPTKREAARMTGAVIIFALAFAAFVQVLDLIFSKIVKEIIL